MGLQEFFNAVKNAEFAFTQIRDFVISVSSSAAANPDFANIWQFIEIKNSIRKNDTGRLAYSLMLSAEWVSLLAKGVRQGFSLP